MRRALAHLFIFIIFLADSAAWAKAGVEALPASRLAALKKKPCTLIHVWATWCAICVDELPQVLKMLAEIKRINPVLIDISEPLAQKTFSVPWVKNLAPPFKAYYKPPGNNASYIKAIEPGWSGVLPYSVMFHQGKKKKEWLGQIPLDKLGKEIAEQCE